MPETKPSNNREKHSVKIIIVGVPQAVINVIYLLHGLGFAKASDWLEVKQTKDPEELTMVITLDFML